MVPAITVSFFCALQQSYRKCCDRQENRAKPRNHHLSSKEKLDKVHRALQGLALRGWQLFLYLLSISPARAGHPVNPFDELFEKWPQSGDNFLPLLKTCHPVRGRPVKLRLSYMLASTVL